MIRVRFGAVWFILYSLTARAEGSRQHSSVRTNRQLDSLHSITASQLPYVSCLLNHLSHNLLNKLKHAHSGGNAEPLFRRMEVAGVRTDGDAVKIRALLKEEAAFKTDMDRRCGKFPMKDFCVRLCYKVLDLGIRVIGPAGISFSCVAI